MRHPSVIPRLWALIVVCAACGASTEPGPAPAQLTALPRALTSAEQTVLDSGNAFTFALLRQLAPSRQGANLFVSPLSASMALSMTMNGAAGTTLDAMRATLGFDTLQLAQIDAGYKGLIALLQGLDPTTTFTIANSVWYRNSALYSVNTSFASTVKAAFGADATGLNFTDPSAVTTINQWVSAHTANKIPTIIDGINPAEVMFLVNAIYFDGTWRGQFDPSLTRSAPFYGASGVQTVSMMDRPTGSMVRMTSRPGLEVIELPYGNDAFAMTIVLPDSGAQGVNLDSLAAHLTLADWNAMIGHLAVSEALEVLLPRFTIEDNFSFVDALTKMGMGVAFTDTASFPNLLTPAQALDISRVLQKTYVDVNEHGTVAAAVTVVGIGDVSLQLPFRVVVNRPFLLVIRDRLAGTILFIGKVENIPA